MADRAQDFRNADFSDAQAVVLAETFSRIDQRFDALDRRMDGLERRMERLETRIDDLYKLVIWGMPALFLAQTAILGAIVKLL